MSLKSRTSIQITKILVVAMAALSATLFTTGMISLAGRATPKPTPTPTPKVATQVKGTQVQAQANKTPTPKGPPPGKPAATPTPPGKDPIVITGSTTTLLVPGRAVPMTLTLTNPNNQPVTVKTVNVTVNQVAMKNGVPVADCNGPANVEVLSGYSGPDLTVPQNGSVTVADPQASGPWIRMKNTNVSQDACKDATFFFTFSAQAVSK